MPRVPWFNCHVCWSFSGNSLSCGWRLSRRCDTSLCDVVAGVTGQISAPYKCFYKLWRGYRGCCRRLPRFYFSLGVFFLRFFFFGCQQLPPSVRLLLTNIDWAVSDFLGGCAPLHRQPHLSALLLSLLCASAHCSRSGLWPGRHFLTAYTCAHRAETFVWKSWKKKMKKGKRRNRFYMHMYVFVCQCSGAPHTQIPVILLLLSRLYK